ncbi:MAG: hypothetical protein R2731_14500 [Nocardioides sp.]
MTSTNPSERRWRSLFLATGAWTLLGAVPALVDPARTYRRFHAGEPSEEELLLFRGSSGQTFLFAVGYLAAAVAPRRHALLGALGGTGKAVYAVRLLREAAARRAGRLTLVAAVGDLAFAAGLAAFLARSGAARTLLDELAEPPQPGPSGWARS